MRGKGAGAAKRPAVYSGGAAVDRPEARDDRHVDEDVSRAGAGKHLRQFSGLGRGFEIVEVYMVNFPGKK